MIDAIPNLLDQLRASGWATLSTSCSDSETIVSELDRIGRHLGPKAAGRAGALTEIIDPKASEQANPHSLSARFGLDALPMHTELSHRTRPCRYVILGCLDPGSPSAETLMLDWRSLTFSPAELNLLESAPVLARSGRRSFYTTLMPRDRAFLRYDRGCLEAVGAPGALALKLVEDRVAAAKPERHDWRAGDVLAIDNWRMLHGRGRAGTGSGRKLARIYIDG